VDSRNAVVDTFPFSLNAEAGCYECGLPPSVYQRLSQRYSCGGLKRIAFVEKRIPTGRVCLGKKWLATEGPDLTVQRVIKTLTFDPEILNDWAPANLEAAHWYKAVRAASPFSFPTEKISLDEEVMPRRVAWGEVKS
jgi:hypothetical protein